MTRETLIDFFNDLSKTRGDFIAYDNGFRSRSYTYAEISRAARIFAARLRDSGIAKGDKVLFWSENRPEWIAAFWGCLLLGVVVVPIDYRTSSDFLQRVQGIVQARLLLTGDEVSSPPILKDLLLWRFADFSWSSDPASSQESILTIPSIVRDDVAEIIFTSGATSEPKGVVITHRNLLANIVPVEREVEKYRKYGRPFFPLRFLNLLPLSHLFGQAMAVFIPAMLPGVVVFMRGYNPNEIVRLVHSRRISVVVSVPKILDVLREHVLRSHPDSQSLSGPKPHVAWRWWKHRNIHRMFGWKFWSFVVGAAPLDPELEEFWSQLGFLVVQGYGLTETAPIVSLNHPFHARKESVGKAMPGVEIKIAPDGEILVRGENVTSGYYHAEAETAEAFEDGWFHTGDIGSIDEEKRLYIRGRKKEMIVTPEGLNVFPEDVERVLNVIPGVRESAVAGISSGGEERVHAVVVLESGGSTAVPLIHPAEVMRLANTRLADHQKIRGMTVWPGSELPRTEGTRKLKRREIRASIEKGGAPKKAEPAAGKSIESILAKYTAGRVVTPSTTLEELGLSSLERVELLLELEDQYQTPIDETAFSQIREVKDLGTLVENPPEPARGDRFEHPSWPRSVFVRGIRWLSLVLVILPLSRIFAWIRVEGREHLRDLDEPVIFAANHQSHMDAPVIFAALPSRWRYRVAPAMTKEFFKAHFYPAQHTSWQWLTNSLNYLMAVLFFNAFPLPQHEGGVRQTLRLIGDLTSEGYSILIFPEGRRGQEGKIDRFQAGVGMMASRLDVAVVPVRLEGLDRVLHATWKFPRPGRVRVVFGLPMKLTGEDYAALARKVEDAVRNLQIN